MKDRPEGFLSEEAISHDSEQFDYIRELHSYLWKIVKIAFPFAEGPLKKYLDIAIEQLEYNYNNDN